MPRAGKAGAPSLLQPSGLRAAGLSCSQPASHLDSPQRFRMTSPPDLIGYCMAPVGAMGALAEIAEGYYRPLPDVHILCRLALQVRPRVDSNVSFARHDSIHLGCCHCVQKGHFGLLRLDGRNGVMSVWFRNRGENGYFDLECRMPTASAESANIDSIEYRHSRRRQLRGFMGSRGASCRK